MNLELVWLLCPLCGLLSQLGGTYNKIIRRWGVPSIVTLAALLFLGFSWWWPVLFISLMLATTLPFTLIGNSIYASWFNWIWIYIAGYLFGLPCVLLSGKAGFIYALVPCLTQGICGTLSNIPITAKYMQWKLVEFLVWSSVAYCYALSISLHI